MQEREVIDFYRAMEHSGITVWIDGGWGVDALLGKQTRPHSDLDIATQQEDAANIRALLEPQGYREIKLEIARPHNFVLGDDKGHEIDVHVIALDAKGNGIYGPAENGEMYPAASLAGIGTIAGHPMRCISPEWMVRSISSSASRRAAASRSTKLMATWRKEIFAGMPLSDGLSSLEGATDGRSSSI